MVISRSQDGSHRRTSVHDSHDGPDPKERDVLHTPPLLMAPPDRSVDSLSHKIGMIVFRAWALLRPFVSTMGYFVRLGLFVVKMVSLARPCWPYMVSLHLGIPLVAVAALDLGLPRMGIVYSYNRRTWGIATSLALLILHFSILWMTSGRAALCAMAPPEAWPEFRGRRFTNDRRS